jgi:tetratricopeptide (TPR) repeat protein
MDPVGRDDVGGRLRRVVDDAAAGRSAALLLAGEPGIGKTTLLTEAARYAGSAGLRVGQGWGFPTEGVPGFWLWRQALRGLGLAAVLDGVIDGVLDAREVPDQSTVEDSDRFRLFDEVTSAVLAESLVQPLLIVLDDLQWADDGSLALLEFALRRLPVGAVALLGAYRDVDPVPSTPIAAVAARVPVLRLPGLAPPAVGLLLADLLGTPAAPEVVTQVHERTGGNPFFVEQVSWLMSTGEVGLPPGVRPALARRFDALPPRTAAALGAAAVLGARFGGDVLASVRGSTVEDVEADLAPAVAERLLIRDHEGYRFGHDLLREYGYERLGGAEAARLHAAAVRVLAARRAGLDGRSASSRAEGDEVDLAVLADHARRADPSSADTYAYSVDAAREASRRLAHEQAARHWSHAVVAAPPEDAVDALIGWGDAARRGGDTAVAATAYERAAELARRTGGGTGLARAALGLHAIGTRSRDRPDDLIARLDEALAELPDGPLRWRLLAALARVLAWHGQDRTRALALSAEAVEASQSSTVEHAEALLARHNVIWEPGTAAERLALAARIATASTDREVLAEARLLAAADRLELADPAFRVELDAFFELAAASGQPRLRYAAMVRRAMLALLAGEPDEAEPTIAAARALGEECGEPGWGDVWLDQSWQLAGLRGARAEFDLPAGVLDPAQERGLRAAILLAAGEAERAAKLVPTLRFPEPPGYQWPVDMAHAVEFAGALASAVPAGSASSTVDAGPFEDWYARLAPLEGTAVISGAAVTFLGVVDHHLGVLARLAGRDADARRHLIRAVELHTALGASAWVARSRHELGLLPDAGAPGSASASADAVFRRDGGMWTLTFGGTTVRLRDAKGLSDLTVLLANPGRSVAAADLVAAADAGRPRADLSLGADEVLDETARRRYRQRLADLETEIDEAERWADPVRAERARAEREALVAELTAAAGLAGRTRRLGDQSERARKAVTARIRDTIDHIAKVHPALGAHLAETVTTGTWCTYSPPTPVAWRF